MNNPSRKIVLSTAFALMLSACTSAIDQDGYTYDPWEPLNRKVFAFNDALDTTLFKPVATVYDAAVPDLVQTGVSNFFGNLKDMTAVVNSLLQLKFEQAARITIRVINNSVYGIGGIFDVGTAFGNYPIDADFGSTLAHYGLESGPYVMLPILGPSTLRDSAGIVVDKLAFSPLYFTDNKFSWGTAALNGVSKRARLLDLERSVQDSITDKYTLIRDSWLQHRWAELNPGERIEGQQEAIDAIFAGEQE